MTGTDVPAVPDPPADWLDGVVARARAAVRALDDDHDLALLVSLAETAVVMPADARLSTGAPPPDFLAAVQARATATAQALTDGGTAGAPVQVRLDLGAARGNLPAAATTPRNGRAGLTRVLGWTLLGGVLPGAGLVASGRRALGWAVLACWGLVLAGIAALLVAGDPLDLALRVLAHPRLVAPLAAACLVGAGLWAGLVVVTHVSLRRSVVLGRAQGLASWALVAAVAAAGLGAGVRAMAWVRAGSVPARVFIGDGAMLGPATAGPRIGQADPWADAPRINMLLIGSDAGLDRTGTRADAVIVASIDTHTGDTVLIGLPRALEHVPFPPDSRQAVDHPDGFACADHGCRLSDLWQFGTDHAGTYYRGSPDPGLTATLQGVEQVLGLRIDDYVLADLRGFMRAVDALGGVEVTVPRPIPVGGHRLAGSDREVGVTSYLSPGRQRLDGYQALWFARSDAGAADLWGRQRCLVEALARQADPLRLAAALPDLLGAADGHVRTSIRVQDLGAWRILADRVRTAHLRSLALTAPLVDARHPDVGRIQDLVRQAVTETPSRTATPSPTVGSARSCTPGT